ncbi:MAG: IMP dehydrogenase [Anaerolineaceae bacterium]|nr:IMP dehydrogenase [Anaerolineaceae bacterium]
MFESTEGLTFDDVLIVPGFSEVLPSEVSIDVSLCQNVKLNIPILSAAMDTVSEARLAIALAREGGIGILHRNMSPENQAKQVDQVKRSESGMITDPITLPPNATLAEAKKITAHFHISGVPIVEDRTNKLVGILTNRDMRFAEDQDNNESVQRFMTSEGLITAPVGTSLDEAKKILQKHRIEKLPLVDTEGILQGLITVKDIQKRIMFPNAAKDSRGRLLVGAAVGVGADIENRIALMVKKGLDIVVIDTAHGHSKGVVDAIKRIKKDFPDLSIMAGNVVTAEGTEDLIKAGADMIKVGVGAGSICTTRIIAGAGMAQLSAIYNCVQAAEKYNVPIIADGGIKYSGDIVKAIAAGAKSVMLGSMLAGLDESPGEVVIYEGRRYKAYRGMGSVAAMQGFGKDRYGTGQSDTKKLVPEGVEGIVPYKGNVSDLISQLIGGLRSGMGYAGAASLEKLRLNTKFSKITNAGLIESHPHNVFITREAPNYQQRE